MDDWSEELEPHPDANGAEILQHERQRSKIDVDGLSRHLFGDVYLSRQARITAILSSEKIFDKTQQANLSRPDRYLLGLARGKRMRQLMDEQNWDDDDLLMAEYLIDDILPYHLHISLFQAAMREQCSTEQAAHWMPLIDKWQIIGAYAQTELGHGSNVRGIECEARWDQATQEFIIHSPTLTASKWWNGTLGRTATHAVVVAQLMLPSKDQPGKYESKGPRPFIVQVRDLETHLPFPSIIVGDINAKYGYASMDNAYCLFRHHRVPHSALLSRYAQLNPSTGAYTRPQNAASVYGQLTRGRSVIVMNARLVIARAVTVAVRYLSIRRQFRDTDDNNTTAIPRAETPVLDYTTVQIRIIPLLATFFALHYSGTAMRTLYERARGQLDRGQPALASDAAALAELHSTSAGLKSLATDLAANSVEICRRAMGGHGFGGGTGLIQLNNDYLSKPTVEGDNWMITQQVARFLVKMVGEVVKMGGGGREGRSETERNLRAFLDAKEAGSGEVQFDVLLEGERGVEAIVNAFAWRASWMAWQAYEAREVQKKPWNSLLVQLYGLSKAYSESLLVSNFHAALLTSTSSSAGGEVPTTTPQPTSPSSSSQTPSNTTTPPPISPADLPVLRTLFRLHALTTLHASPLSFLSSGCISLTTLNALPATILGLMSEIRPHAVRLVDSLAVPDFLLDSALGRSDGRVYEDLWNRAHRVNPLNELRVNPWFWEGELVRGDERGRGRVMVEDVRAKL